MSAHFVPMSALATEQAGSVAQLAPRVIVAALEASLSVAMSALASPEQAGSVAQLAPRAIEAALEAPLEDEDRMMASLDTLIEGARSPRAATIVRAAIEARWGLAQLIEQGARPASVARPGRLARILWLTSKLTTDADGADACSRAGAHLLAAKVVCGDLSAGDEDAFEAASAVIEAVHTPASGSSLGNGSWRSRRG
ncbi:hypothetical protein M885DRAFT_511074 [Pelagophyceae sp. CCMP2097]|nr:hypothetical protein M885DRAFT_511074 [Pelagophyceae sp. CCMP2097]